MYRIAKRFRFSASHQLLTLPETHKCHRLHGHNYEVEVVLQAETLNGHRMILDYGDLKPFQTMLDEKIDHRHLNDLSMFEGHTTAEHLAFVFYTWCANHWPETVAVRVSETKGTWAEYGQ